MEQRQVKEIIKEKKQTKTQLSSEKRLLAIMIIIAAVTTIIFIVHSIVESTMNYESWRAPIISYFTIQSNIIIAVWFMIVGIFILIGKKNSLNLSAVVTTYILVTGVIYWAVLVPMFAGEGSSWMFSSSNIWMHTTMPVIALLLHRYIKSTEGKKTKKPNIVVFYIYPILYIIMAIMYAVNGTYLYPMFNADAIGWGGVAACLIVMMVVFTGVYVMLLRGRKAKTDKREQPDVVHLR